MTFPAETAARWVQRHHSAVFRYHDPAAAGGRLLTTEELVRDELPSQAEQLVAQGTPRPAAGMYLAGWYAGTAAEFVALSLVASGAGYLLDPDSTRWWRHPDGYADALDFADVTRVVVLPGHPWSGQPHTRTVTTQAEQAEAVVTALVARHQERAGVRDPQGRLLHGLHRARWGRPRSRRLRRCVPAGVPPHGRTT